MICFPCGYFWAEFRFFSIRFPKLPKLVFKTKLFFFGSQKTNSGLAENVRSLFLKIWGKSNENPIFENHDQTKIVLHCNTYHDKKSGQHVTVGLAKARPNYRCLPIVLLRWSWLLMYSVTVSKNDNCCWATLYSHYAHASIFFFVLPSRCSLNTESLTS